MLSEKHSQNKKSNLMDDLISKKMKKSSQEEVEELELELEKNDEPSSQNSFAKNVKSFEQMFSEKISNKISTNNFFTFLAMLPILLIFGSVITKTSQTVKAQDIIVSQINEIQQMSADDIKKMKQNNLELRLLISDLERKLELKNIPELPYVSPHIPISIPISPLISEASQNSKFTHEQQKILNDLDFYALKLQKEKDISDKEADLKTRQLQNDMIHLSLRHDFDRVNKSLKTIQ